MLYQLQHPAGFAICLHMKRKKVLGGEGGGKWRGRGQAPPLLYTKGEALFLVRKR